MQTATLSFMRLNFASMKTQRVLALTFWQFLTILQCGFEHFAPIFAFSRVRNAQSALSADDRWVRYGVPLLSIIARRWMI